jgi:hypothetical protein
MDFRLSRNPVVFLNTDQNFCVRHTSHFVSFALLILVCIGFSSTETEARFVSQFSLTVGEEFNDNIFFSNDREHDLLLYILVVISRIR